MPVFTITRTMLCLLTLFLLKSALAATNGECVVLLHGLARTALSMEKLAGAFEQRGYIVANVNYPSRKLPIEALSPLAVENGIESCGESEVVHFVIHSLGGILVRYYLKFNQIGNLGKVVMLAPPNKGSKVVDKLRDMPGFAALNGPAGLQLGTGSDSLPSQLAPVEFELGIIAGSETFNPILSLYLSNPDDGKVSVESTRVKGMRDFVVVPHSHTFMMRSTTVIDQVVSFIESGKFVHNEKQ